MNAQPDGDTELRRSDLGRTGERERAGRSRNPGAQRVRLFCGCPWTASTPTEPSSATASSAIGSNERRSAIHASFRHAAFQSSD
jgi:hypothetical protein